MIIGIGDSVALSSNGNYAPVTRLTSQVTRADVDGCTVYIKRLSESDWEGSTATLRARIEREASLLERLGQVHLDCNRLGRQELVFWHADELTIATRAIPGDTLDRALLSEGGQRRPSLGTLRATWLAGRWLSRYQTLECLPGDAIQIGELTPTDLVEYCQIRLARLAEHYPWMTSKRCRCVLGVLEGLVAASPPPENAQVWSHGDYAPGNIIWDGETLTPIDFTMARVGVPLQDVTYFIHRLEMLQIYFPWRLWPIRYWRRAFLRGYGRPDAESSPMYRALMIRHLICRLLTYVLRVPRNTKQSVHARWVRLCVRRQLMAYVHQSSGISNPSCPFRTDGHAE